MPVFKVINYNGRFKRPVLCPIFLNQYFFLLVYGSMGVYSHMINFKDVSVLSYNSFFFATKRAYHIFFKTIKYLLLGLKHGFFVDFRINGVGYKAQSFRYNISYELGHSHYVIYKLPYNVASGKAKYRGAIFGNKKDKLFNVGREIKNIDFPDSYKGKGFRYSTEILKLKVGKQRQR